MFRPGFQSDWRRARHLTRLTLIVGTILATSAVATVAAPAHAQPSDDGADHGENASRPRVILMHDPELDNQNTLIRYLLYSNEFDTEGLVYTSSGVHWAGDGKGTEW